MVSSLIRRVLGFVEGLRSFIRGSRRQSRNQDVLERSSSETAELVAASEAFILCRFSNSMVSETSRFLRSFEERRIACVEGSRQLRGPGGPCIHLGLEVGVTLGF